MLISTFTCPRAPAPRGALCRVVWRRVVSQSTALAAAVSDTSMIEIKTTAATNNVDSVAATLSARAVKGSVDVDMIKLQLWSRPRRQHKATSRLPRRNNLSIEELVAVTGTIQS
ncbi:hypothetical protein JYU34_003946, partial [Plutella xylostella]